MVPVRTLKSRLQLPQRNRFLPEIIGVGFSYSDPYFLNYNKNNILGQQKSDYFGLNRAKFGWKFSLLLHTGVGEEASMRAHGPCWKYQSGTVLLLGGGLGRMGRKKRLVRRLAVYL